MPIWLEALVINGALAAVAAAARLIRPSGVWGGLLVGIAVYLGAGRPGFLLLLLFFAIGSALTRIGYRRKARQGLAEPNEGRRGGGHALANGGVAAICALGMLAFPGAVEPLKVALAGSLAAALADTAGSEVGGLLGRHPISPVTLRPVRPGTEGAVSLEGTLAGVASAAILGGAAVLAGCTDFAGGIAAGAGGVFGSLLESVVGSFRRSRRFGHMALNAGNTVAGAGVGVLLRALLGGWR
jgi:uncharacterized protein (TIGR00297 family)